MTSNQVPGLNHDDAVLLMRLRQRLAETANVETGEPTSRLLLIRDLRLALQETGQNSSLAVARDIADRLMSTNILYRKA